jgi:hypothetical protein
MVIRARPKNLKNKKVRQMEIKKVCPECAAEKSKEVTKAIFALGDKGYTLEMVIDGCGDALITLWKNYPEIRKYLAQTLTCIEEHTVKEKK